MVLETIQSPEDLKALDAGKLDTLADELRRAIVGAVARTGGHLGSNLGAVELTIALHRAYDSPRDRLLWDTGHQAYVHKMLTGRLAHFDQLRQAGGLSGYPARDESDHDIIENSHASTALSWAYGVAEGQRLAGDAPASGRVVAVVGDGALTGGMAYEALNNIGHDATPVTIVLNDNGRSYAETISRLSAQVQRLRFDPRYRTWRDRLDGLVEHMPLAHRVAGGGWKGLKQAVSDAPSLQAFVEALGIRYAGPYDGHDIPALERAFRSAARVDEPLLVHVLTKKGKGYEPAETDPEMCLHDTSAFDIATGRSTSSKPPSWTSAFSEALVELADERPELVALTAAMPGSTGLLPLAERHPDRVIDVGIAEQHAVTSAAGLAHAGRLPVVAVYSTFFSRAFDQANLDVGLHDEHVVLVFDRAGITGSNGPSHHGILDLALCLRIPTMSVLAPSSREELAVLLREACALSGPVAIRFPKGAAQSRKEVGTGLRARLAHEGVDATVCVVSIGDRLAASLDAADLLAAEGVEVDVWDARAVRPVDARVLAAAADAELVVTVENGIIGGGAGSYLADRLVERTGVLHAPPVLRLGVPDAYLAHGNHEHILAELGLDGPGIAAATRKALTG